jgi:hypothetical protein
MIAQTAPVEDVVAGADQPRDLALTMWSGERFILEKATLSGDSVVGLAQRNGETRRVRHAVATVDVAKVAVRQQDPTTTAALMSVIGGVGYYLLLKQIFPLL